MATPIPSRPARTWRLRNPRNDDGEPLTDVERVIHPSADIYRLIGAIVAQAVADLDAGYTGRPGSGSANEQYWRAQAYLWFFHGTPTGFEIFTARLGLETRGMYPEHPLFDDAAELRRRRNDLNLLALPVRLFDRRIDALKGEMEKDGRNWVE